MLTELISRYDTIGHRILDLEAELGINTEPYKEILDRLIEEARARIQVKDAYTREDALGILRTIDNILRENYRIKVDLSAQLLSLGLQKKVLDCDSSSFVYLSIAEALELPLTAVNAPQHLFVGFMLNGDRIDWETTSAKELNDNNYIFLFNISPKAIDNGVFLRNLTRQETIAIGYFNRGIAWRIKGNLDWAIADFDEAIVLNPNYAIAYNNRGTACLRQHQYVGALLDFARAKLPILR